MRLTATLLALILGFLLQGTSPVKPKPSEPKKSPAQIEKERIEREIEGVWEIYEYNNSAKSGIVKASGFMVLHDGWMSLNVVVTSRDNFRHDSFFQDYTGTVKRYEVTNEYRVRVTNVWGFVNKGREIEPDVAGNVDERQIIITGPRGPGQRLRMSKGSDTSYTFIRRSAAPPLPRKPPRTNSQPIR